ncbi:hypothetical protein [Kineosporia succinea]|uniref:Uncharacterized protein n=1 Tax=Kineosporia succinea TaxID=84632 RepID=A0ABT9PFK2_9ACTN|nr:hypothetical protein [Kineosporia succinea]MDP9830750.1 hypothetical protein [Kineosporia succinea]
MTDNANLKRNTDDYAVKAAEVAAKLKPGTYDAVQALALVSIASSLARIADQLEQR